MRTPLQTAALVLAMSTGAQLGCLPEENQTSSTGSAGRMANADAQQASAAGTSTDQGQTTGGDSLQTDGEVIANSTGGASTDESRPSPQGGVSLQNQPGGAPVPGGANTIAGADADGGHDGSSAGADARGGHDGSSGGAHADRAGEMAETAGRINLGGGPGEGASDGPRAGRSTGDSPMTAGTSDGSDDGGSAAAGHSGCTPRPEVCDGRDDDCDGQVDEAVEDVDMACQGRCGAGRMVCDNGALVCQPDRLPQVEICNGIDDDCDTEIDEGVMPEPCDTTAFGRCRDGVRECVGGALSECVSMRQPTLESCNDIDDDCDGETDEPYVAMGLGDACRHGIGACAADGRLVCNAGGGGLECDGVLGQPRPERCNGQDDDCNGTTDDVAGLNEACTRGTGICLGRGVRRCIDNTLECVADEGQPRQEVCNGEDDDCDGTVDEGFNEGQTCRLGNNLCDLGIVRCRLDGSQFCAASALVLPGQPEPEGCNTIDDDCDGEVDEGNPEGGAACNTGLTGTCLVGEQVCTAGAFVCLPPTRNDPERCNGQDDDCDERVDEGFDVTSDVLHCGACNQACPEPLNTTAVCQSGQCSAPCDPDTYDNDDEPGCEYACTRTGNGRSGLDPCDGADDDCDGRADEGHIGEPCDTDELGMCREGVSVCRDGLVECVYATEPVCEVEDGRRKDEDCDGQVDEASGAIAACAPPDSLLERVCIQDNQFYYGMDMVLDGDDIVFSRANLLLGSLHLTRLRKDGSHTDERIQTGVLRLGAQNTFDDSDLIKFNDQFAVCYQKRDTFFVSIRQNDGTWVHETVVDGASAGADCALAIQNGFLVTAYTRGNELWFGTRIGDDNWSHERIDGANGDVVGQDLDLVIHNNLAFVAHRNDTQGRLRLTYQDDARRWLQLNGPPPVDQTGDSVPDPQFGSGFRPALRVTDTVVQVAHGTRPQDPDETGDGYLLWSQTSQPPGDRFTTENVSSQDGYGGGQALVDYGSGYILLSRYRLVSALFSNVFRLETAKSTDRRIARILPDDNFDGVDFKHNRLNAASDKHGLPVYSFVFQQGAVAQVCVYRPLDTDRDGTPDVIEAGQ
ncbi:MAG: MopE-related protein [Myxococcota bacterium]|nr:MopE-related protein [Myxococcota bacterium]